jgi:hypothetical protein
LNLSHRARAAIPNRHVDTWLTPVVALLLMGFAYYALCSFAHVDLMFTTVTDYYPRLIDSMAHGHVYLTVPEDQTYDLAKFQDHWYMYWGPGPILFVLPFYLKWGVQASDIMFTVTAGVLNVWVFALALREFVRYFKLALAHRWLWALIVSFAFGSPNLYLAVSGRIWSSEQVIAALYLLLFYFCFFRYLNKDRKPGLLLLAVAFFCLAWLSRYSLIFHGLLFGYLLVHYRQRGLRLPIRALAAAAAVAAVFGGIALAYNYLKFGSPFETGQQYIVTYDGVNERFETGIANRDFWSLAYLKHNVKLYFLNWMPLSFRNGFTSVDVEGNSVFSVYPALLFLFALPFQWLRSLTPEARRFLLFAGATVGVNVAFLLLYFAAGWVQFGSRYFFDVVPLLFLCIAFVLRAIPNSLQLLVVGYGVCVNLFGALWMYDYR